MSQHKPGDVTNRCVTHLPFPTQKDINQISLQCRLQHCPHGQDLLLATLRYTVLIHRLNTLQGQLSSGGHHQMHQPIIHAALFTCCPRHHQPVIPEANPHAAARGYEPAGPYTAGSFRATALQAMPARQSLQHTTSKTHKKAHTNTFNFRGPGHKVTLTAWLPYWLWPSVWLVLLLLLSHWAHHQPAPLHKQGGKTGQAVLHA